jgi:o-succinylbenzoate synthase
MTVRRVSTREWVERLDPPWPGADGPVTERRTAILVLDEEDGRAGFGEAAPWPGFALETLASSRAALGLAARRLIGLPGEAYLEAAADLHRLAPVAATPCARHAIDLALHDLAAQAAGVPIARLLAGTDSLEEVPANATIPRVPATATAEAARSAAEHGFRTLKIKVGGAPIAEDAARVRAAREAAGADVKLRLDANQAWTEREAIEAIEALREFHIEYVEQPVSAEDTAALARVRAAAEGVPIAADESVRDLASARAVLDANAADVLIVKPMVLGGLAAARRVALLARERGVDVVVTFLLEGPVGAAGALHLAASLGPSRFAHGLVGPWIARRRNEAGLAAAADGRIRVPKAPGLGVRLPAPAPGAETRLAEAAS